MSKYKPSSVDKKIEIIEFVDKNPEVKKKRYCQSIQYSCKFFVYDLKKIEFLLNFNSSKGYKRKRVSEFPE